MDFDYSPKTKDLQARLLQFMDEHVYPNEAAYKNELAANTAAGKRWTALSTIENLKPKAQAAGLWNLFLPVDSAAASGYAGAGLTNQEYAPLAEIMGRVPWASEVFNCSAPDTGNMETIARYGDDANKARWLKPLLEGKIRSAFAMTEPDVASSDATNIETRIERDGDEYVINGRKWWISGAGDPRCKVYIVMGKTDPEAPKHSQQSMILVPADTPGVTVLRPLNVFGYDDAPHGHMEVEFKDVRVPKKNLLGREGMGFVMLMQELAWERLMIAITSIAGAEAALKHTLEYTRNRKVFGKTVASFQNTRFKLAEMKAELAIGRVYIDRCIELVLNKKLGVDDAATAKYWASDLQGKVIDQCLQLHGGYGYMLEYPIARAWIDARAQRIYGGTNEIMKELIARTL